MAKPTAKSARSSKRTTASRTKRGRRRKSAFRIGRASAGLGLFAVAATAQDAFIVSYSGKRIATTAAHERERRYGARYMFEIDRRWTIDGSPRSNLGRYVNHSCAPNAEAVVRQGRIAIVALRDIAPGEEITMDYGPDYFALFIAPAGCRCAACHAPAPRRQSKSADRDARAA